MYKLSILFFLILLCLGCNSNRLDSIDIPNDIELDVNGDGNPDFNIIYLKRTEGDPIGNFEAIRMNLESEGTNQILKSDGEFSLFLNDLNLIQSDVTSPLYWEVTNPSSNRSTLVAKIQTDYDGVSWNNEWTILSKEEQETYFIGLKIFGDNTFQLGFIEFSIDESNGQFNLIQAELL